MRMIVFPLLSRWFLCDSAPALFLGLGCVCRLRKKIHKISNRHLQLSVMEKSVALKFFILHNYLIDIICRDDDML